jgi:thiol-disulfide isomerase/thioredoxin
MKYFLSLALVAVLLCATGFTKPITPPKNTKSVYIAPAANDSVISWATLDENNNRFIYLPDSRNKEEGKHLDFSFELATPRLLRMHAIKPMTIPVLIYVQPGDSVTYKKGADNFLVFEGKNAAHYNFFQKIGGEGFKASEFNEKDGVLKYKEKLEQLNKKKLIFLDAYARENKVSKMFVKRVMDVFAYQYYNQLLNPYLVPVSAIKASPKYLDGIDFGLFRYKGQEDNAQFYGALASYLDVYSAVHDSSEPTSDKQLAFKLKTIDANFSGELKEFAVTQVLSDFEKHLTPANINAFTQALNTALGQVSNKYYKTALEAINQKMQKRGAELPKEVLNCKLTDVDGKTITFGELLKTKSDSIKVIDFWASWCQPCIKGIKETYAVREKLAREKNVKFLYFSTDRDANKWKDRVAELAKIGVNKDHYLITDEDRSVLNAYFSIDAIPRYIILSSTNKTYLNSFPSPGSAEFEQIVTQFK